MSVANEHLSGIQTLTVQEIELVSGGLSGWRRELAVYGISKVAEWTIGWAFSRFDAWTNRAVANFNRNVVGPHLRRIGVITSD